MASEYGAGTLAPTIRSRVIHGVNGLDVHILEAGYRAPNRPLALLLHGFPDLAYGWRHLMSRLAEADYHVVAPDQRGFGRTTGWVADYDVPPTSFGLLNMARDALALVLALGYRQTSLLVGHDLGSPVASYCALARPDVFTSLVLVSAPFPGAPAFPFNSADDSQIPSQPANAGQAMAASLAALNPPRKYYQQYLSTPQANTDLSHPPQGMQAFLRTLFHVKSADWAGNLPRALKDTSTEQLAQMPAYYIMPLDQSMPQAVAPFNPSTDEVAAATWLTDAELAVYVEEYSRTGFQGPLQAYRVFGDSGLNAELRLFSGKTIDVPCLFIGGQNDWATYSAPGALEAMKAKAATNLVGVELIDGSGHWIQQEQPVRMADLLLRFKRP